MLKVLTIVLFANAILMAEVFSNTIEIGLNSAENRDSNMIAKIVEQQILAARNSTTKAEMPPPVIESKAAKIISTETENHASVISKFNGINPKILFLMLSSIIITAFVLFRRIMASRKKKSDVSYRLRIDLLRNEKLQASSISDLKSVRAKLSKIFVGSENNESYLAKKAKKLNITKGELLLASRIHAAQN